MLNNIRYNYVGYYNTLMSRFPISEDFLGVSPLQPYFYRVCFIGYLKKQEETVLVIN